MKAYLSYSCLGYQGVPDSYMVGMHKISAYCLKKNFGEVHLITDSKSKPYFMDIPWTSVSTSLDQVPTDFPHVWSLSKLYAFREIASRGEPFIHTDNDAFLWKGLPERLRKAEVFGQHPENVVDYRYDPWKFYANCPNKHIFEVSCPPTAINVGIVGGTNVEFFKDYSKSAIAFVQDPANSKFWKEYNEYWATWCKAVLAEQWFLNAFALSRGIKVETLFSGWPTPEEVQKTYYTHLMGKKRWPNIRKIVNQMADRVVKIGNKLEDLGFGHEQLDEALAV